MTDRTLAPEGLPHLYEKAGPYHRNQIHAALARAATVKLNPSTAEKIPSREYFGPASELLRSRNDFLTRQLGITEAEINDFDHIALPLIREALKNPQAFIEDHPSPYSR